MKNMTNQNTGNNSSRGSRGVALITVLLLLSLFTVMTLAMVIATSSDTIIDGYYRNYRGSFYASDSGLNAARQYLVNNFQAAVTAGWTPASGQPITAGSEATVFSNLTNSSTGFGANQSIVGTQTASWPGNFFVDATRSSVGVPTCTVTITTNPPAATPYLPVPTCTVVGDPRDVITQYHYDYPYTLTVVGQSRASELNTVVETGDIVANISVTNGSNTPTSFAAFGTLLDNYGLCSAPFVPGTMSGQFFSNDSWNFGDSSDVGSTKYIFTGAVGAHNSQVGYFHGNSCDPQSTPSDTAGGTTINPTFQSGLNLNQQQVPLPTDTYSQQWAVLNGYGACTPGPCTVPAQTDMHNNLKDASGAPWPATAPSTGVFLPYTSTTTGGVTTKTFSGGGIYVQGDAKKILMSAGTVTVGLSTHKTQVFTITQGSTITTVTIDLDGQTTTISDNAGNSPSTIMGVPENMNATPATEACMLYVNGNISGSSTGGSTSTGLSGPASGAAIPDGSAVTVTATGTIAITGNITYAREPVTLNAADTLITSPTTPTNVLGIFTPGGDVQFQPTSSGNDLEVDASIAMISSGGSGGMTATWNSIHTLTIVGGRIANNAKSGASITNGRNIWFDQRFASGFAPPWFPTTVVSVTGPSTYSTNISASRTSWVNTSAQ